MQRREFLVRMGGVVIAVPAVLELVGCGDDSPSYPSNADRYDVTSSNVDGHTHRITVPCSDLGGGDVTYTSTSTGHTHTVVLLDAQVQMVAAGGQVIVTSSSNPGPNGPHTHDWTIRTPSGTC